MLIDLHTHSSCSDGTASPTEVVEQAAAAGIDVLGLTDHDTAAGWDEALSAAQRLGIGLVRGMEISTKHDGRSVHLLAYLPDPTYPPLVEELDRIIDGRGGRIPEMIRRLQAAGYDVSEADVMDATQPGAVIGRPHVADALVAKGLLSSRDEAFATLLGSGGVGYVPRYGAPLAATIELVAGAGGVTVVAHPWGRGGALTAEAFAELVTDGLCGIEVDHQDHAPRERVELRGIADDLGLVVTGSSDFHGTGKVDHELGCNSTQPEQLERLLAVADSARATSGRPAPEVLRATGRG